MQHRYSNTKQAAISSAPSSSVSSHQASQRMTQQDDLTRIFNTAMVSSHTDLKRDFSAELYQLTQSASFKAILSAVRQLSNVQGVSERQAAEQVIETFRKMDEVWSEYLYREGVDRLRQPRR